MKGKEIKVVPLLEKLQKMKKQEFKKDGGLRHTRLSYNKTVSAVVESLKELEKELTDECLCYTHSNADISNTYHDSLLLVNKHFGVLPSEKKEEGK